MLIGDLSSRTGVSRRLLRYYEDQGLLRPSRLANGYRDYAEADVASVGHIRALLAAGLPTTVIARLLDCVHGDGERLVLSSCPGLIAGLRQEHRRLTAAITELQASRQALEAMLADALVRRSPDGGDPRKLRQWTTG